MEEGDDSKATGKMLRAPIPFPSRHYHFYDNSNAGVIQGGVEINDLGQEREMSYFRAGSGSCMQSNACCAGTLSGSTRTSTKTSRQKLMANYFQHCYKISVLKSQVSFVVAVVANTCFTE